MSRSSLYPPSVDPGFPSLGNLPRGWTRTTFGDVLDKIERPIALKGAEKYRLVTAKRSRGGIVLRSELLGREILTKTQFETNTGDFLISRRQIIHGACGVVPESLDRAVVSNEYSTLRTRPGLLMDYLRHYCHTPYFQRTCFHSSHGVDVEKMIFKIDEWLAREVDLPPLPEQRKIAAILSSVDCAIEASQAVIDQLQVVKKAMMAELLTKGIPGRHKRFKQTELGEVPEEWEVAQLGSLASFITSGSRGWAEFYAAEGALFVRSQNVRAGVLDLADRAFVRVPPGAEGERTKVAGSDILVTITGNSVGNVAEAPEGLGDAYVSQHVGLVRLKDPRQASFVAGYLSPGSPGNAQVLAAQYGQSKPGLSLGNLRSFWIPLPPAAEMEAIQKALGTIRARLSEEDCALFELRFTKSALMSVLLTGEVRVRTDEGTAA